MTNAIKEFKFDKLEIKLSSFADDVNFPVKDVLAKKFLN